MFPYSESSKCLSFHSLSEKSKKQYEIVYKTFLSWQADKKFDSFSEEVILEYFTELSEKYKSSSLWANYSMLRSTLCANHGINIENYSKVRALLRSKSVGYQPKKSKSLTPAEIKRFLKEAPDHMYLATKVALIMGVMGSCKSNELHAMKAKDIQDLGSAILVTVPNAKARKTRRFSITGHFYYLWKKYASLRPPNVPSENFFVNYQQGKCTTQNIGINKFGSMGKQIARFLNLPDPQDYTGHCFKKSYSILFDVDDDATNLNNEPEKMERVDVVEEEDTFVNCEGADMGHLTGAFIKEEDTSDFSFNEDSNDPNFCMETNEEKKDEYLGFLECESLKQKWAQIADEEIKLYNLRTEELKTEMVRKQELYEVKKKLLFEEHEEKLRLMRAEYKLKLDFLNKSISSLP